MSAVTIIGAGGMAAAIAGIAAKAGADVQVLARDEAKAAAVASPVGGTSGPIDASISGEVVVLALPWPALDDVLAVIGDKLAGKVVVDITNPVDFATFDSLVVPADSSQTAALAERLPAAKVVKAFNTTFGAALVGGTLAGAPVTVLVAGDDDAKAKFTATFDGPVAVVDAGSLRRARELEAFGFLQITLAARGATGWDKGFQLVR
ncbi:NADPH-dependent F420 reductase [Cellulomonas composti]|uniref:Dinucleotide-binding protein n=1 Tax=Cellulomonas composti TaxID=266130 RepID=A0A511JA25_9CELL|nr:NAD(P)-binding domain-containing protein [Cellulomonas composti]GEL94619.1 dinucleotide-binding protein [Cellulomonas composti]